MEVTTSKISKTEASKLIQKVNDALEREKIDDKREEIDAIRKYNILNILENLGSIFTGAYLHYKNVPKETMFAATITERTKLRRGRLDEIERKEQHCLKHTLLIIKVQVICTKN